MSNIKWSGIEQWKYGLTARWYVSAYYGNDTDVDAVGLYNPSTNPTGHGGPTRPFATVEKMQQSGSGVLVIDGGYYSFNNIVAMTIVGDGNVILEYASLVSLNLSLYNVKILSSIDSGSNSTATKIDCQMFFCTVNLAMGNYINTLIIDSVIVGANITTNRIENLTLIRCSGQFPILGTSYPMKNLIVTNCPDLTFRLPSVIPSATFADYSIIIGTVKNNVAINGKISGITLEDFKADGRYFRKSYSEVDLFGNTSGSGATVSQLNEIFNNFYYPYIDDYHNLDLTLRPDCDERVRFGGLNGTYIGALPVGYRLSATELWNTHIDVANTSNLAFDMVNNAIVLATGQDVGTYTSLIIDLGLPITVNMVDFLANFVYNVEGTAKQGVSNQRIDTTPDLSPDNTKNQRVVYDYRLQYSPDGVTALTDWVNLELNRMPTIDGAGLHQLDDGFNQTTAQKLTIQRLKLEFTLRRVIIA